MNHSPYASFLVLLVWTRAKTLSRLIVIPHANITVV